MCCFCYKLLMIELGTAWDTMDVDVQVSSASLLYSDADLLASQMVDTGCKLSCTVDGFDVAVFIAPPSVLRRPRWS